MVRTERWKGGYKEPWLLVSFFVSLCGFFQGSPESHGSLNQLNFKLDSNVYKINTGERMSPAAIKKQEKQGPLETFGFSELDTAYATT